MKRSLRIASWVTLVIAPLMLTGCVSDGYKGDIPAIGPQRPANNVKIELEEGDMICVVENNDRATRSCVPVAYPSEGKS